MCNVKQMLKLKVNWEAMWIQCSWSNECCNFETLWMCKCEYNVNMQCEYNVHDLMNVWMSIMNE